METFDLSTKGLEKLKETIRVEYPKRLKKKALKIVNEVIDEGLDGNYTGTRKYIRAFSDHVTGTIYYNGDGDSDKMKLIMFYEYGTGTSGKFNPHPEPHPVEYKGLIYNKYNTYHVTVGQPSHPIFYGKVQDMKKKLKELGG